MDDDARLEALEIKLAHLERAFQELSDVLYRQQRQLDASEARLDRLLDRLGALERGEDPPAQFEVPPHY
jgi:SlyX protein